MAVAVGTCEWEAASRPAGAARIVEPSDPALLALGRLRPWRVGADIVRCYALIACAWAALELVDAWWMGVGINEHWRTRVVTAWLPILVVQLMIVAAASAAGAWWYYLVFWLGPLYVCVFVPKKLRVWCEHGHPILPDEAMDGRRLITFAPNRIERWFLAPSNMHYHAEHHLWPFVPYYNLPALHRLAQGHPAIEVRGSYVGYLRAYFRALPLSRSGSC